MVEVFGAVFGIGFFGLVTHKNLMGSSLSLQVMMNAGLLALVAASCWANQKSGVPCGTGGAGDIGIVFLIVFQIQALASLAYSTRLRRHCGSSDFSKLNSMRN